MTRESKTSRKDSKGKPQREKEHTQRNLQATKKKGKRQSEAPQRTKTSSQKPIQSSSTSSANPVHTFFGMEESSSESDEDEVRFNFIPRAKYPRDFWVQNKARTRQDQVQRTNEMIDRAAAVIITITAKLVWAELSDAFDSKGDILEIQAVDVMQDIEIASDTEFLKEAVRALINKDIEMDFTCSRKFKQHRRARVLVAAWGIYQDMTNEPTNDMKTRMRRNFMTRRNIDEWLEQKWLSALLRTVQRWTGGISEDSSFNRTVASKDKLTRRIFSHIMAVSEAMCVSQAVQADTELNSGQKFERETDRAKYVAELLNWKVQNAVKRREDSFIRQFIASDGSRGRNAVERKATLFRDQVNRLNAVNPRGGLVEIPTERWKTTVARIVLIVTIITSVLVGVLNAGKRNNTFEKMMDGTSVATFLLASVFGPWKLKSDDQDVLTKIFFGIKRSTSFRDVAKFVCDGDKSQLAFLLHLVQGDRKWLSSDGACFVRGKTGGAVSARVPITGRSLAEAGSIFGQGVLLAPDWKTYFAVTGSEQHANLEERDSVQASNVAVTGTTRFTGRQCEYCESLEEVDEIV